VLDHMHGIVVVGAEPRLCPPWDPLPRKRKNERAITGDCPYAGIVLDEGGSAIQSPHCKKIAEDVTRRGAQTAPGSLRILLFIVHGARCGRAWSIALTSARHTEWGRLSAIALCSGQGLAAHGESWSARTNLVSYSSSGSTWRRCEEPPLLAPCRGMPACPCPAVFPSVRERPLAFGPKRSR
jgi:hypothetical protein